MKLRKTVPAARDARREDSPQALYHGLPSEVYVKVVLFISTGAYMGFFSSIPGTLGTVGGLYIYFVFSALPMSAYLLSILALFFLGSWSSGWAERILGKKDHQAIVIDEIVGFPVAMAWVEPTLWNLFLAFVLFRAFDIIKFPPIKWAEERLSGGYGVMLDDVIAGIYANACIQILSLIR